MNLSIDQQQLLQAWVDGDVTEAEAQIAQQLLQREDSAKDASEYVGELKRLRSLMAEHAGVSAPAGLRERVIAALSDDFAKQNNVVQMPRVRWHAIGFAAAAAVVVSVALVFSGGFSSEVENSPETSVAHEQADSTSRSIEPDSVVESPIRNGGTRATRGPVFDGNGPPPIAPENLGGNSGAGAPGKQIPVLRLDRGKDTPLELSLNVNRNDGISATQVYNDLLIVSSFYGNAELADEESQERAENEEFAGRDLSQFEGLRVELNEERLPELLAALERLSNDQGYGDVIVPHDLQRHVEFTTRVVDELQKLEEDAQGNGVPKPEQDDQSMPAGGAWGYLPPDTLGEQLRKASSNPADVVARIAQLDEEARQDRLAERTSQDRVKSRKVSLVIHLR